MSKFYIAILVSECNVTTLDTQPFYQECFTLIKASSCEDARQKAEDHAVNTVPTSYLNCYGETVTWKIKRIGEVQATLDSLDSSREIVDLFVRGFDNYEAYECLFKPGDDQVSVQPISP